MLARYSHPLAGGASLSFQVDAQYKDKVYQDPANLEFGAVPAYTLANARGLEESEWEARDCRPLNLGDEDYLLHNFPSLGMGFQYAGPPRMALLSVSIRN